MTTTPREWVDQFAAAIGVTSPTDAEIQRILELAGVAARSSERTAAPITCWLAAQAGLTPSDALGRAEALKGALEVRVDDIGDQPA